MTIREKLEHGQKYGYPVCIKLESGDVGTGFIRSLSKTGVSIDWGVPYCLDRITSVEAGSEITEEATAQIPPGMKNLIESLTDTKEKMEKAIIAVDKEMSRRIIERNEASKDCDDTPDVEIAEIDSDETWGCTEYFARGPKWAVSLRDDSGFGIVLTTIGQFTEEKYAKAAATLPELVKQRDRLLEAAKALVKWLTHNSISQFNPYVNEDYMNLRGCISEIEKNPLIRLTDPE